MVVVVAAVVVLLVVFIIEIIMMDDDWWMMMVMVVVMIIEIKIMLEFNEWINDANIAVFFFFCMTDDEVMYIDCTSDSLEQVDLITREIYLPLMCSDLGHVGAYGISADKMMDLLHRLMAHMETTHGHIQVTGWDLVLTLVMLNLFLWSIKIIISVFYNISSLRWCMLLTYFLWPLLLT